jgi:hypothetical protein
LFLKFKPFNLFHATKGREKSQRYVWIGREERRREEKGNKDLIPLVNLYLISGFMVRREYTHYF